MMSKFCWRRLGNTLRALRSGAAGAAAAEFAIITPVIGFLLSGTMDLAQLANQGLRLDAALRAGAAYAIADPTNKLAVRCVIGQSVTCPEGFTRYATFPAGTTVTVNFCGPGSGCPDAPEGPTGAYAPQFCVWDDDAWTNGVPTATVSCDNDVAAGGIACSGTQCPKHYYVKIQAVESGLSPIMQWVGMPTSITRTLTVRRL